MTSVTFEALMNLSELCAVMRVLRPLTNPNSIGSSRLEILG